MANRFAVRLVKSGQGPSPRLIMVLRGRRHVMLAAAVGAIIVLLLIRQVPLARARHKMGRGKGPEPVRYLAESTWAPPPVEDPSRTLAGTGDSLPSLPAWNRPKVGLHGQYGLDYAPPLLIGFTRAWPVLLQAVVSYITAGWPPEQIWVVENTGGAQRANAEGRLTLQNPLFLDHGLLRRLGVRVVAAPVMMTFSQLQNFYTHLAHVHDWPFYFWSHMDVLVLSFEDGLDGVTPPATEPGYRSVYEICLAELERSRKGRARWSNVFFSYDHLTLVNREAYDDVGGWDPFIPYYMNDCDMHSRLTLRNWTQRDARAAIVTDVSTVLDDLRALYRDPSVRPAFTDPNPPPPPPRSPSSSNAPVTISNKGLEETARGRDKREAPGSNALAYFRELKRVADTMFHYKHGDRGRNTWQLGQRGGQGEPFYYPARGIAEAVDVLTEAGREVFRRKWGHRDCDLISGTQLRFDDQWRVDRDWE